MITSEKEPLIELNHLFNKKLSFTEVGIRSVNSASAVFLE